MQIQKDFDLKPYNTFGISALCDRFIDFDTVEGLLQLLPLIDTDTQQVMTIGAGSNLLLTGDYHGTVIHSAMTDIEVKQGADHVLIRCGAGVNWDKLTQMTVANGWHGLENLAYIPGEVGASAVQNIGAYGVEVKSFITRVEAIEIATGRITAFDNHECEYAYRDSIFKNQLKDRYVITHVTYKLSKSFDPMLDYCDIRKVLEAKGISQPTPEQLRTTIIEIRKNKLPDPQEVGNAGSFFVNPVIPLEQYESLKVLYPQIPGYVIDGIQVKVPAAWMIEQCGFKGQTYGRVGVHEKQALVLVNRGGADGKEVVHLCEMIQTAVNDKFGVKIHPEVNIR